MYENVWVNPLTVMAAFCLGVLLLSLFKPYGARIFIGFFFLVMAFGVNLTVLLTDPALIAATGQNAFLPVYSWFFTVVIAAHPVLWMIPLILFEASVGILILAKGKWTRLGLIGAVVFCLWLTPVGIEETACPILALAIGLLLRKRYERSLAGLIAPFFRKRVSAQ